jgi:hypothetical protein
MQIQIKRYKAGRNTDIITQVSKSDIPCTSLNLYHTEKMFIWGLMFTRSTHVQEVGPPSHSIHAKVAIDKQSCKRLIQWLALVNTVMNLRVPQMLGNYRVTQQLVASQEGLNSMG